MDTISVSQALQIAGRAGRYGTQYEKVIKYKKIFIFISFLTNVFNINIIKRAV